MAKAPVTYIPVSENKDVSMGIFVIREGQGIPLHDHPHMHGIIKCLKGNLKITSFTKKVCLFLVIHTSYKISFRKNSMAVYQTG